MKSDPNVLSEGNPLDFLSENPRVWSDTRVAAIVKLAPTEFRRYAAEIQQWREMRAIQIRAAQKVQKDADELAQSRRVARRA